MKATDLNIDLCVYHNNLPRIQRNSRGLWVAYCGETNCELTGVYKSEEEAIHAWNDIMARIAS